MNKLSILVLAASSAMFASAKGIAPVGVDSISFARHGDYMVAGMLLNLRPTDVPSGRAELITPLIISEKGDTIELPSVGVYGRLRYINFLRNDRMALTADKQTAFKASERPGEFGYEAATPYSEWMDDSQLVMRRQLFGCANCLIEERFDPLIPYFHPNPAIPEIVYFEAKDMGPVVESLEGAAYVDFIVDKTNIEPSYRRNPQELFKIQSSIDTVLNDPDVTITGVWLKGFASPESPYSHNTDLAIGRTKAIKDYINRMYHFKEGIISTDYEPEDWAGLRRFVENSNMEHKAEILEIIDSDMAPDPKEAYMKKKYPEEYKFMLATYYPALRHTEYRITYEVKRFDDLNKIREVMRTKPNRLTLREFFLLGNACQPGSDEFNEVYETAVRMYPNDPVANINAANAALQRKDYGSAERYLSKAGDSPEAVYARGSLAFILEQYDKAEALMKELPDMQEARDVIEEIGRIRNNAAPATGSIMLE